MYCTQGGKVIRPSTCRLCAARRSGGPDRATGWLFLTFPIVPIQSMILDHSRTNKCERLCREPFRSRTYPQKRLSRLWSRLSPITKYDIVRNRDRSEIVARIDVAVITARIRCVA